MVQFQNAYTRLSQENGSESQPQSEDSHNRQGEASEDATMKAANRISRALLQQELTRQEKEKLGPIVHYIFGTAMGGFYGMLVELRSNMTAGFGSAFAMGLFLIADEIAVPAMGLSRPASEAPLSSHLYGLASHLVYGITTEGVRRGIDHLL
jgi:hypothetical protein